MIVLKPLAIAIAVLVAIPLTTLLAITIFIVLPEARSYFREGLRLLARAIDQTRVGRKP
jgi:hypothetical protein